MSAKAGGAKLAGAVIGPSGAAEMRIEKTLNY
jgi:hypothetical protein